MTLQADEVQITANNRYGGNDRYSGMKSPDRFSTIAVVDLKMFPDNFVGTI